MEEEPELPTSVLQRIASATKKTPNSKLQPKGTSAESKKRKKKKAAKKKAKQTSGAVLAAGTDNDDDGDDDNSGDGDDDDDADGATEDGVLAQQQAKKRQKVDGKGTGSNASGGGGGGGGEKTKKQRLPVGRKYTVSVALPGSIVANAQSPELRTYLAGQIARALVVFNVDEVVIFPEGERAVTSTEGVFEGAKKTNPNVFLARVLQYLEMPQYLRKAFFPMHPDLKYAGLLNPLDSPHHMRSSVEARYREGVVMKKPSSKGSFVNVGLLKEAKVDRNLQPGVRVTVEMDLERNRSAEVTKIKNYAGKVVAPTAPREQAGLYWGYQTRLASSFADVFAGSPFDGGYDVTLGTSERGERVDTFQLPTFQHLLVVFGGLNGLEASLEADETLGVSDVSTLFDSYLNTCPDQGSATIRTEEALLITMSALRPRIVAAGASS